MAYVVLFCFDMGCVYDGGCVRKIDIRNTALHWWLLKYTQTHTCILTLFSLGFFPRFYSSMNLGGTVSFIPSESLKGRKECDSTVLNANMIGFGLRGHRTLKRAPKEWNTVYKENRQSALSAPTAVKTHQLKPSSSNVRLAQPDYILSTRAPTPEGLVNLKGPQNIKRFPSVPYIGEKHDDPALLHPNLLDLPGLEGVYVVSNEVSAAASMEKILQLGDDVW